MSEFDYVLKRGDTAPLFEDSLTLSNGQSADLSGATVTLVVRSLTADEPITLTGPVTVLSAVPAVIQYAPSEDDSTIPAGDYMGSWVVQSATTQMSFPTEGYLSIRIEENLLTAAGGELLGLPDLKSYLGMRPTDRAQDAKLIRLIRAARPIVESITGPIIPTVYDERHDGGGPIVQIRRRPSTSYGTDPILELQSASEDLGTTTYDLTVVDSPSLGSTYSCMIDQLGTITRLANGSWVNFAPGTDSVRVVYRAGQASIPENVYEGTLELLRVNYETTQTRGSGYATPTDQLDIGPPLGFFMPRRVAEILSPNRRAPSIG